MKLLHDEDHQASSTSIKKRQVFTVKLKTRRLNEKGTPSSKTPPSKLTLLKRKLAMKAHQSPLKQPKIKPNEEDHCPFLEDQLQHKQDIITEGAQEKGQSVMPFKIQKSRQEQLTRQGQPQLLRSQEQQQPIFTISSPAPRPLLSQQVSPMTRNPSQPMSQRVLPTQAQLAAQVPPYPSSHLYHKGTMLPPTGQQHPQYSPVIHSSSHLPPNPSLIQQHSMPLPCQDHNHHQTQDQHFNLQEWQQFREQQQKLQQQQQQQQQHLPQSQQQQQIQQIYQQQQHRYHQYQQQLQYQRGQQQAKPLQQQHQQQLVEGNNQYYINRQSVPTANPYQPRIPSSQNPHGPPSSYSSLPTNSPPFLPQNKNRASSVSSIALPPNISEFNSPGLHHQPQQQQQHPHLTSAGLPALPSMQKAHSWVGGTDQWAYKTPPYGVYHPTDDYPQQQFHQKQLRLQQQQQQHEHHLHQQQKIQQQQQMHLHHQQQQQQQQQHQHQQNILYSQRQQHMQAAQQPGLQLQPLRFHQPTQQQTCPVNISNCPPTESPAIHPSSMTNIPLVKRPTIPSMDQAEATTAHNRSESFSQMQSSSTPSTVASRFDTSQRLSPLEPNQQQLLLFSSSSEHQRADQEIADFLLDPTKKNPVEDDDDDEFSDIFAKRDKKDPLFSLSRKTRNQQEEEDFLYPKEDAVFHPASNSNNNNNNHNSIFEETELQGGFNNSDTYFTTHNNNNSQQLLQQHHQYEEDQNPCQIGVFSSSRHPLANSNFFSHDELHSEDHFLAPFRQQS